MKRTIILALILVVCLFASATVATTISLPEKHKFSHEESIITGFNPCGDPIDGDGPPGAGTG